MHMAQIREDGEDLEAVSYFQNLQYLCVTRTTLWTGQLGTSVPIRPFISLDLTNLTVNKKTIYHLDRIIVFIYNDWQLFSPVLQVFASTNISVTKLDTAS